MRPLRLLIGKDAALSAPPAPVGRRGYAGRRPRRRLDDQITDIYTRATAANRLDDAADLLAILEKWHDKRKAHYGRDRRIDGAELSAMRTDLERLLALRRS
jgi:hypothetical protein